MTDSAAIKKAEVLYAQLSEYLKSLDDRDLDLQTGNACDAVRDLQAAETDAEKEEIIRKYFNVLFPARGGLTDVILWDSDYETRVSLNEPIAGAEKELWALIQAMEGNK